jgi:hypothetical protein
VVVILVAAIVVVEVKLEKSNEGKKQETRVKEIQQNNLKNKDK